MSSSRGNEIGCENLIQSHQGPIFLFPAVPEDYSGDFKDYYSRGAFVVSASIKDGKITAVTVKSLAGMKCSIDISSKFDKTPTVRCRDDRPQIDTSVENDRYLSFETDAGKTYEFVF